MAVETAEPIDLYAEARRGLAFMQDLVREDLGSFPHLFIIRPEGKLEALALPPNCLRKKSGKLAARLAILYAPKAGMRAVLLCGEVRLERQTPVVESRDLSPGIKDSPEYPRQDCIGCWANAMGRRGIFLAQPYRRRKGESVFEPVQEVPASESMTRFSFDLTDGNVDAAIAQARDFDRVVEEFRDKEKRQ